MNKKISEFDAVAANQLTDVVPVLQAGNKITTLQKIRDLFAGYFAIATTVSTALGTKANTVDVTNALATKADLTGGKVTPSQLPSASGWTGNTGDELRAGFDPHNFVNPEVESLAKYVGALIADLKANGALTD